MTLLGTTHLTLRLAVGATALVALAACSNGSTAATPADGSTGASPSTSESATTQASPSETASDRPTEATSEASPSASTPPAPTATATPSPTEKPRLIAYAGGESAGVEVHTREDARKLTGAPAAFKAFIGSTAQKITDTESCDADAKGVLVETLRTDGYAAGGVNECGGYAALWAVVDGQWKEIAGTQDSWECKVLTHYAVPRDIVGDTCYDYDAQQEHDYHQK